jgi:prolyl-tRNA synthetase
LSAGVRFKDADLLGFPLRVVVGARGLKEGLVELRGRRNKETVKVTPSDLKAAVLQARDRLLEELEDAGGR